MQPRAFAALYASLLTLALSACSGGAHSTSPAADPVTPAPAALLKFSATAYAPSANTATLSVDRSGGSAGAVGVAYASANGTATAGAQYTAVSGTLDWSDGDVAPKAITVAVNATSFTGSKTFSVVLSSPSGGATLGTASAAVTMQGTQPAPVGNVSFSASNYNAGSSSATLNVERNAGSSGMASVNYATHDGSAVSGSDYTASSGSLTWKDGDAAPKTISVPISTDGSGNTSFTLALSNASGATLGTPASATVSISGMAIKVAGNHLVDGRGAMLQLRGASVSGLESVAVQGWDSSDPWGGWKPVWSALQAWKINVIRLPMNEASWLDYQCIDSDNKSRDPDLGKNYRATVAQTIQEANAAGIYVILDLQWTAPSNFCPVGQNAMADADHSVAFWTSVASTFKGNPAVVFELFNEPYVPNTDAGWDIWLNGGTQTSLSTPSMTFTWQAAGEQTLLNAVRATGATNVVLIGGTGYSNILTQWPTRTPQDPLNQLAAAWHVYSDNGFTDTTAGSSTVTMLATVSKNVPLVITEVGDADGAGTTGAFAAKIVTFADAQGYSYLGWTWNHWNQSANDLILDNSGTPTIGFGTYFKEHLVCRFTSTSCP